MNLSALPALAALLVVSPLGGPHVHHHPGLRAPACFGKAATIVGTSASETINGTQASDVIVGGGGNDTINGRGGDDRICDPSGPNNLNVLRGGPGADQLRGSASLFGNGGDDVLEVAGTVGSTVLVDGGAGNDTLRAPVLKAVFVPGPGRDRVTGNSMVPNDAVSYAHSLHGVVVDLATGVATGEGRDHISEVGSVYGGAHADVLRGDAASNELFGLRGDDTLQGRAGDDFLYGMSGADHLNGGAGSDWCDGGRADRRFSCEKRL